MKAIKLIVVALALGSLLFLGAGCNCNCDCEGDSPPTHIVYIEGDECYFNDIGGDRIDPLWVFPGDRFIMVNIATEKKKVKFDDDSAFAETEVWIEPGERNILYVKSDATGDVEYTITPGDCGAGAPKVNVGGGP